MDGRRDRRLDRRRTRNLVETGGAAASPRLRPLLAGVDQRFKFAVPVWAADWLPGNDFANTANGWLQTHIVTAHVALGSLLLGTSVAIALTALRRLASASPRYQGATTAMGATT